MAEKLSGGGGEWNFEGENVRGYKNDGSYNWFDMYPRQAGETNEEYGKRLKDMREYAAVAELEGEERERKKAEEERARAEAEYAESAMGKLEARIRAKAGSEKEVERGDKVYTHEQAESMIAAVKGRAADKKRYEDRMDLSNASEEDRRRYEERTGAEGDKPATDEPEAEGVPDATEAPVDPVAPEVEEEPVGGEEVPDNAPETAEGAEDEAEKGKEYEKILHEAEEIDAEWREKYGGGKYDYSAAEIRDLSIEELKEMVAAFETGLNEGNEGAPGEGEGDEEPGSEEDPEGASEEEPENLETSAEEKAAIEQAGESVKEARAKLAEISARRRGLFGRKHGGEQEKAYNEAREEYNKAVANLVRLKMAEYRKSVGRAFREKTAEVSPEELEQWKSEIEAKRGENEGQKLIEFWAEENAGLIVETKERIDNGNIVRKIGKFMDKCPRWAKVAGGVALSVGLGAFAPAAGLAGAVAISAGKAILLTRTGSRNSAINENVEMFVEGEQSEETNEADGDEGEELLTPEKIRELPKDQTESYSAVAEWITNQHTEAILKDKYDNRRRTLIATGSAIALTIASHVVTNMISGNASAGGEASQGTSQPEMVEAVEAPEVGGGVELGGVTPEVVPTDFNLDYVAPPGSTIGQAFRSIFNIEPGSEAYNQALQMFEDVTGAVRGQTHVWANTAIADTFGGTGKTALEEIAKAIANGTIKP